VFKTSTLYTANLYSKAQVVINQGGTYSGKTYSIMQVLFSLAISKPGAIITVTGEDIPNLKRGSLRDAQTILSNSEELQTTTSGYNGTERIFKFNSGSIIEFVSYMNEQDARNGKRDYLFINEAQGISWGIAEQLINRTNIRTFIDYNPSFAFWPHEKLIYPGKFGNKSVQTIISDHRHNPFLSKDQHDHIEKRSVEDPEWGKVYGRGLTGRIEGLIFRNWDIVDEIPKAAEYKGTGLDFGFTNDPTAAVRVWMMDQEIYVDCPVYESGLVNPEIAKRIKDFGGEVIADSAEPKSIKEIQMEGVFITGALKGKDSVNTSIDILKRYKIHVLRSAVHLIKELNSYKWRTDKATGLTINEPVDFNNHAIDALRYFALNKLSKLGGGWYGIR
jgi:phage terminase large subunit